MWFISIDVSRNTLRKQHQGKIFRKTLFNTEEKKKREREIILCDQQARFLHHHNELAALRGGKIDATIPRNINSNKMLLKNHARNGEQSFEGGFTITFSFMHIYNGKL